MAVARVEDTYIIPLWLLSDNHGLKMFFPISGCIFNTVYEQT